MKLLLGLSLLVGTTFALHVNLDSFRPIIEEINALDTTWKANTDMADHVTISSFKKLLGARKPLKPVTLRAKHSIPDSAIPDEFDARVQWPNCPTISQIRDQGQCGSCWAVAAASAFSDRLCIATNGTFTAPLSSEELTACCEECGFGCEGGYPDVAWEYFADNGLVTGGEYQSDVGCQPYSIPSCDHHTTGKLQPCGDGEADTPTCQKKCTNKKYTTPFRKDHHKVSSSYTVQGVKEIQKEIMTNGPVEAAFDVYDDFPTYKSGVYQHKRGSYLGGHAVRVIGWGTEKGTPYWLIANSWNEDWGDNGIFKIIRGKDNCGIEDDIVAGLPAV